MAILFLVLCKLWRDNFVPRGFLVVSDTGFPERVRSEFELCALSVPGLQDALEPNAIVGSSTPNSLVLISQPHVPVLQVLPATASSTWFDGGA